MSAKSELESLLKARTWHTRELSDKQAGELADAILAAGYRRPGLVVRTIDATWVLADAEAKLDRLTREEACDRDVVHEDRDATLQTLAHDRRLANLDAFDREPLDGRGTE